MSSHEILDAALGAAAAVPLAEAHQQQPAEFTKRTSQDILEGVHRAAPGEVPPAPEAMSEAHRVDTIAYASYPGQGARKQFVGRNVEQSVVVPYEPEVILPPRLASLIATDRLAYGRTSVTQDPQSGIQAIGGAYLYHGAFHASPANSDKARDYTIVAFPVPAENNRDGVSTCTYVVPGRVDFERATAQADWALPGLSDNLKARGVTIHPAGENHEIELSQEDTLNEPDFLRSSYKRADFSEASVRQSMEHLVIEARVAMDVALQNAGGELNRNQLAERVLLSQEWKIQQLLNDAKLSAESVPALRQQLEGVVKIEDQNELAQWVGEHGIAKALINDLRSGDARAAQEANADRDDGIFGLRDRARVPRESIVKKIAGKVSVEFLTSWKKKRENRQREDDESILEPKFDDEVAPVTAEDVVVVDETDTHLTDDKMPRPQWWKRLHTAFMYKATERSIGRLPEEGKTGNRIVRIALGATALAITGVGLYTAIKNGGGLHDNLVNPNDLQANGLPKGIPVLPHTGGAPTSELIPQSTGAGVPTSEVVTPPQAPSVIPGTHGVSPDVLPSAPSATPTPDQLPGTSAPTSTPGHIPSSTGSLPPETTTVTPPPAPEVVPGTGATTTFDPNAIGISTPDTNTLPANGFHLSPGQSLSEYVRGEMPNASTSDVYKEVARVMHLNGLPTNVAGQDPFEAARHIRPQDLLRTR
ncbi:MAG TPA: hypothetical protein VLH14_01980 [Patescibacteria group bacterium]|nr:hypothetical protein [Patescibacteria group bacterium]